MTCRRFFLLALSPFLLGFVLGCGSDAKTEHPKVVKGGVDPEKAKTESNMSVGFAK